jgi:hypothetical protein
LKKRNREISTYIVDVYAFGSTGARGNGGIAAMAASTKAREETTTTAARSSDQRR